MTDLSAHRPTCEHAEDVIAQALAWTDSALVMVTGTEGGGVRAPGALMAVRADGCSVGYVSGGCIDADVVLQAQGALQTGRIRRLRYGAGSPFLDLPLPCGGGIDLVILPSPDRTVLAAVARQLAARRPVSLGLSDAGQLSCAPPLANSARPFRALVRPKLRVRIAGKGADGLAMARLCQASGLDVHLQLTDSEDAATARRDGIVQIDPLSSPQDLPDPGDDAATAFVLMLHDPDWEPALLQQALSGPAFYIGAVGSRTTHARRCARLEALGTGAADIDRVRGPIGLIPSMRDASMLAVSALADIVAAWHSPAAQPLLRTGLLLLAAGRSERFETGDKLLAPLAGGRAVLEGPAGALSAIPVAARLAVTHPHRPARRNLLEQAGWQVIDTPAPDQGMATSLRAGISALRDMADPEAILVLLGDMPSVSDRHLIRLQSSLTPDLEAVLSESDGQAGPPALFSRQTFDTLMMATGDRGARDLIASLTATGRVALPLAEAHDIDRVADLAHTGAPADA